MTLVVKPDDLVTGEKIPCPDNLCVGAVVEVDQAIRWNSLVVTDKGRLRATNGPEDWERRDKNGFICDHCLEGVEFEREPEIDYP